MALSPDWLFSQAAHIFIYGFMSNKSEENPEGILNQEVLKSFLAIESESGNFTLTTLVMSVSQRTGINL